MDRNGYAAITKGVSLIVAIAFVQVAQSIVPTQTNEGELIFAAVVYRHGDRTPTEIYPNDPWGGSEVWPSGLGELTQRGMHQQFELGTWLRKRYIATEILRNRYNHSDICVQSSDYDRTLMSAGINLAALYPPTNPNEMLAPSLAWQPVPVHTVPRLMDDLICCENPCPAFDALSILARQQHTDLLLNKNKDFLQNLRNHSGYELTSLWEVLALWDTLYIEQLYNMSIPAWAQDAFADDRFLPLANEAFRLETLTPQLARLKYGRLLKDILQRFQQKADETLVPNRLMHIYSGHDTTISGLLNTMGMFELHGPPYTATLLFELRQFHKKPPIVQIFYRNSTDDTAPRLMFIPKCGTSCPLSKMFKLYEHVLPSLSSQEECNWPSSDGAIASHQYQSSATVQPQGWPMGLLAVLSWMVAQRFDNL